MRIISFFKLAEIRTKVASVIPFLLGTIYTYYRYNVFKIKPLVYLFLSLICIDMATTIINNMMDFKRAQKRQGYNYEEHNTIVQDNLSEKAVMCTIGILLTFSAVFGIVLYSMTDVIILLIGILAFGVGIGYSYGPIPLSRIPLGEIFSGLMMGGFILFVTIYCQVFDTGIIEVSLRNFKLMVGVNLYEILVIAVVSVPFILMISNIMLANNTCDLQDDIENKRYTLPYYIGRRKALKVFEINYYISYIAILAGVILKWLPYTVLLTLFILPIICTNINKFKEEQNKAKTFVLSVNNFVSFAFVYLISILISILMRFIV